MSNRVTRGMVEAAVKRLADAVGKSYPESCWTRTGDKNRAIVGAWSLDYNPIYGGYIIEEMMNESGGVIHPVGSSRMKASEFFDALRMATDAVYLAQDVKRQAQEAR